MDLEDRLRRALRPVEPGDGFVDRVIARIDATPPAPVPAPHRPWQRWALAASVLLAVAIGADVRRNHRIEQQQLAQAQLQAREQAAGRQLAWALEITSRQLESVHRRLDQDTRKETGS
jgi:hypothetical protein